MNFRRPTSLMTTTLLIVTTAILIGAIVATSNIYTEAFAKSNTSNKKQKSITLTFQECSGTNGNHEVHCSVTDTGITDINCIVPNPEISGGDNLGYCNANNGQKLLCTIPPHPGDFQCEIVKSFTCTSDYQCQVNKGRKE
jgi:hypothetical protein